MASFATTPESIRRTAQSIREGRIKSLRIQKRNTGPNAGTLFTDYVTREPQLDVTLHQMRYRERVAEMMEKVSQAIEADEKVNFKLTAKQTEDGEKYAYIFEVK